jgi:integrase/recombinase XerC
MRRFLSNSQVRQLLAAVDLRSPFGQRDYLLIMFLYHTGLRVGECSRLLVTLVLSQSGEPRHQLDLPAMFCKGPRGRVVPLNATARACITKQLAFNRARGLSTAPGAPLFQNSKHCPLSVRSIQLLIRDYRIKSDLDLAARCSRYDGTPHTLRHTNGTELHRAGVPIRVIQQGLGHRHLSTTERYLGVSQVAMESAYAALGG